MEKNKYCISLTNENFADVDFNYIFNSYSSLFSHFQVYISRSIICCYKTLPRTITHWKHTSNTPICPIRKLNQNNKSWDAKS